MKAIALTALIALTIFSCGQQEKTDDPFGKSQNPQRDKPLPEGEFTSFCTAKKGTLDPTKQFCLYESWSVEYGHDEEDAAPEKGKTVRKELGNAIQKIISMGSVGAGSMIFGEVKGGQAVQIILNNAVVATLAEPRLAPTPLPAGKLEMRLSRGMYEYLNVYVMACTDRFRKNVPCPR
jgi:hypothetical protein